MALLKRRAIKMAMKTRHAAASNTSGSEIFPKLTNVAGLATMIFALRKPMNAMNRPMPAAVPCFEAIGNGVDDLLANVAQREQQEKHAREKDDAERGLPRHAAPENDGVSEVDVQRHSRRESDGIVRVNAHDELGDRGGNTRGEEHAVHGHVALSKDLRVDDHDVGHGHESGQAREQFTPHRRLVFFEMKNALK